MAYKGVYTLFGTKVAVFRDNILCACPVFVKIIAIFVLNKTINVVAKWTEESIMTIQVEILQFLHYNPSSSRVEISAGLTEAPNERTLKRIIAELAQNGDVIVEGKGRATRYSLSAQAHLMMPLNIDTYFIKDIDDFF